MLSRRIYSVVCGSSQPCRRYSSLYLFIVVPMAIVGVLMVVALLIFNITVNSGSFITYIFPANMMSSYPLTIHLVVVTLLSLFNLDLNTETCFYNGMDDYTARYGFS